MFFCTKCNNNYEITKSLPDKPESGAHFICKNCGHNEPIKEGTMIMRKIPSDTVSYQEDMHIKNAHQYSDMIHNPALPRTRNYVCPNQECESHFDHKRREAVFFRVHGYQVRYACVTCGSIFYQ